MPVQSGSAIASTRLIQAQAEPGAGLLGCDPEALLRSALDSLSAHVAVLDETGTSGEPVAAQALLFGSRRRSRSARLPARDEPRKLEIGIERLTSREREIVQLLAEGNTNKDIARLLDLGVNTVETHRTAVLRKLDISSLVDLVRWAIRNNIVQP